MKLVLNSITHNNCPVELREKLSLTDEQLRFCLRKMHAERGICEAAILQTCNRIEFYVYVENTFDVTAFLTQLISRTKAAAAENWSEYSRQSTGVDVVKHLFEVAAGLDSQMVGENQVLSQIKSAYTMSLDCRMSGLFFHRLFHSAFRVGKTVRTETNISSGAVSVSLAAVELARRKINLPSGTALVIGAGENAQLLMRYLLKSGLSHLIIANRNKQKAQALSRRLKAGRVIGLDDIAARLSEVDLLIGSTSAAEPVVTYDMVAGALAHRRKKLLIIDIAVPRDIAANIRQFKCVSLYNIDDLNEQIGANKQQRSSEIPEALRIIDEFTGKFEQWYSSLNIVPVISQLTRKNIDLAHSEARRYAKDFSRADADKLELFAESLAKKILHGPISFLRQAGVEDPGTEQLQTLDLINRMFHLPDKND